MRLPDFTQDEQLNRLKEQMGIPRDQYGLLPDVNSPPSNPIADARAAGHCPDGATAGSTPRPQRK